MNQIKNEISEQEFSRHGSMKMRRQETPDADFKLILVPCLCDLNEIRAWTQASTASKSPR
jgi:hypothetical protein